ncbi:MAG: DUF1097 domain-containing protein [Clostridiales bacterium]|jgi:hypothetical protein|nr:DUF1097 domain-containing protein [Clostridiales bacterium]
MNRSRRKEILALAFLVALLPPVWAVSAPYLHISVGPIALICAGIYGANGNTFRDALKISLGFLAGDAWALLSAVITGSPEAAKLGAGLSLFLTLFILGFLAVMIAMNLPKLFYLPAWLSGWAIGMLTMNMAHGISLGGLSVQIGAAMLVGVFYVGALVDTLQKWITR